MWNTPCRKAAAYNGYSAPLRRGSHARANAGVAAQSRTVKNKPSTMPASAPVGAAARERALARAAFFVGIIASLTVCLAAAAAEASTTTETPMSAWWLLGAASLGALIALSAVVVAQQLRTRRELNAMRQSLAASASWFWRTDTRSVVIDVERGHRSVGWVGCTTLLGRRPWQVAPDARAPA